MVHGVGCKVHFINSPFEEPVPHKREGRGMFLGVFLLLETKSTSTLINNILVFLR
jgi:hypothetical protein